jgi:hypothetical protein
LAIVRADVSEERITTIRMKRISKLVNANVDPTSLILFILMMEAILSSETSGLTRATRRHIPEDGIFHRHRHENLKSYISLTGWPP